MKIDFEITKNGYTYRDAEAYDLPVHILLSKSDKLKRGQAARALQTARSGIDDRATVQLFSALKRSGLDEARARLDALLSGSGGGFS